MNAHVPHIDGKFKTITLDDKELISQIVRNYEDYSDYNFVSLFTWNVNKSIEYMALSDGVVLRMKDYVNKEHLLYSLLARDNVDDTIEKLLSMSSTGRLELVPEVTIQNIVQKSKYKITPQADEHDYVYRIEKLVNMEEPGYRKFRRALSNFRTKNDAKYELIELNTADPIVREQMKALTRGWRGLRNRSFQEASYEYYAIRRAVKYAQYLPIQCWGLLDPENNLVGFSITEKQGENSILHYEKADTKIPGIGAYLKHQTFIQLKNNGCTWLNYEQDLGLPGLRQAKRSLCPQAYRCKYTVEKIKH